MSTVIPFPVRPRPAARPDLRATLEAALEKTLDAVDHLVARLDELDADPDLEDGGDEEPRLMTHSCTANGHHRRWVTASED